MEWKNMISFILNTNKDDETDASKTQAKRLARHILNTSLTQKVISKQENMVLLAELPLFLCSETIYPFSMTGSYKLNSNYISNAKNLLLEYAQCRANHNKTFDEYFYMKK